MSEDKDKKNQFCYRYPHPAVTVDCIIFALHENDLKVLLIQRGADPFKDHWALPGGFVEIDEDLDTAAERELAEETGLEKVFLEQLYTFGKPKRDPRERIISVAYYSLVRLKEHRPVAGSDAINTCWFSVNQLPKLAFDHRIIVDMAVERLQAKVLYAPIIFDLMPAKFRLNQLRKVYEIILGQPINAESFRKKMLATGILTPLAGLDKSESGPPAKRYRFDKKRYQKMLENGFTFEFKPDSPKKPLKKA